MIPGLLVCAHEWNKSANSYALNWKARDFCWSTTTELYQRASGTQQVCGILLPQKGFSGHIWRKSTSLIQTTNDL